MQSNAAPLVGSWYKCPEFPEIFEIVAIDSDEQLIEIQYFSSELEEIDQDTWKALPITEVAAPEDWSGPYEMNREDLSSYLDDTIHPEDWNSPLTYIEADDLDWSDHYVK